MNYHACTPFILAAALMLSYFGKPNVANAREPFAVTPFECGNASTVVVSTNCSPPFGVVGNNVIKVSVAHRGVAGYELDIPPVNDRFGVAKVFVQALPGTPSYDSVQVAYTYITAPRNGRPGSPVSATQRFSFLSPVTVSTCSGDYQVATIVLPGSGAYFLHKFSVFADSRFRRDASSSYTLGPVQFITAGGTVKQPLTLRMTAQCNEDDD